MAKTFVTADLHFGHQGVCEFLKADGTKLRPWDNADDMNKGLIDNWNAVVDDKDLVYVLGDFTVNKKYIWLARELKGRKILVKGNHDTGTLAEYVEYFEDVRGCSQHGKAILTHIPVHPSQLNRWPVNVHGHLHADKVVYWVEDEADFYPDSRYICVSVEQTNFRPILLDEVLNGKR